MRKRTALAFLAALAACAPEPPSPGPGGHLVVLVVIDQLPSWTFQPRSHLLTGGIRRLLDEGVTFPAAVYPYAATYTAVGHAALGTGAPPAVTGVLANEWYDRDRNLVTAAAREDRYPLLAVAPGDDGATLAGPGASPRALRVDGVGDMVHRDAHGKVVSVSFKDRAAILSAGRHPDLAVWYDARQAAFTTSTYYAAALPAWLADLARAHPIAPRLDGYVWSPRDPVLLARATGLPDDAPGEAAGTPFGSTFPHALAATESPAKAVAATPLADQLTIEAALAAIDGAGLGQRDGSDLLIISLAANDAIGHAWGPESWESLDGLLRLDDLLGGLLQALDVRYGREGYSVLLTSDHGMAPFPERTLAAGRPARRVDPAEVGAAAERAARAVVGEGSWVAARREPTLYLSLAAQALPAAARGRVLDAMVEAIRGIDGIGYVARTDQIEGGCDGRSGTEALLCRSVAPGLSGEIVYGPRSGYILIDSDGDPDSHGSANDYDRTVPILVRAPRVSPRLDFSAVSPLQVAPTLAALLGVSPPPAATEPPLRGFAPPEEDSPLFLP